MSQIDWNEKLMDAPDVLVSWYSGGNSHRFALNRTVNYRWPTIAASHLNYTSAKVSMKGTWYGFLTSPLTIHESVGASIFSKVNYSSCELNFIKTNHAAIDRLIDDIKDTDGYSNADYYVSIIVCARNQEANPATDTAYIGVIEPMSCVVTKNRIKIKLKDPAELALERNVLNTYSGGGCSDKDWVQREIPRPYGEWGDLGTGNHQYGFEVPIYNASDLETTDTPVDPAWNVYKIGDFGGDATNGDFYMEEGSGVPDLTDNTPKIWQFWGIGTSYDIQEVRAPEDTVTYPLSEGYVEAVRSVREGNESPYNIDSVDLTAGPGSRVKLHYTSDLYNVDDLILVQEIVGTTELNQKWWRIHSEVENPPASGEYDYEINEPDGTATKCSDFSAYVSGGVSCTYYPLYVPGEAAGSRDSDTLPCKFWIQNGEGKSFYRESVYEGSGAMTNPVEIIYNLLINRAGVDADHISSTWWSTYAILETNSVKARRWIKDQASVKDVIEEICHDFGLMVFTHAGKYYCEQNRVWSRAASQVSRSIYPKDVLNNSRSEPLDPGRDAIRYDWGVRVYYEFDQDEQIFTREELDSIGVQFDFGVQSPLLEVDLPATPHLNENHFYSTYIYPNTPSLYWDKCKKIDLKWVYEESTAELMATFFRRALNSADASAAGNIGTNVSIIKRTIDPNYRLGKIYKLWDSTCEPVNYRHGQVYERDVDLSKLLVSEKCYQLRITGE